MTAASVRTRYAVSVLIGALWLAMSMNPPARAQDTSSNTNAADQKQVLAIVTALEKAWNEHDMRALANLFHEDGTWVLWTGQVWKGRRTIGDGHAAVHKTVFRKSIQRKRIEELAFVGEGMAVVRTYDTLIGDERYADKIVRSRKLLVLTSRGGIWKIAWGRIPGWPTRHPTELVWCDSPQCRECAHADQQVWAQINVAFVSATLG